MKQHTFEAENEARWEAFAAQVERLDSIGRARPDLEGQAALADFPARYLEVCRDLAVATERRYSPKLLDRLNRLTLAGHRVLYTRDPDFLRRALHFVAAGFPRALRAQWRLVGVAILLFLGPGLIVWGLVLSHPELVYSVMDGSQVRAFEAMYDPAAEHIGTDRASADDVQMFGYYVFNNISIAFRAFAGGLFLGVGSGLVLLVNGVLLGAVSAHVMHLGFDQTFFSFVIGHGAFELTAIVISGAAGLRLGWSLAAPGAQTRVASLRHAAVESLDLVYGVFGMLVVAALLEAFWSSKATIAPDLKYGVGAALWAGVFLYFALAGRRIACAPTAASDALDRRSRA